jgi:hypothetical protein
MPVYRDDIVACAHAAPLRLAVRADAGDDGIGIAVRGIDRHAGDGDMRHLAAALIEYAAFGEDEDDEARGDDDEDSGREASTSTMPLCATPDFHRRTIAKRRFSRDDGEMTFCSFAEKRLPAFPCRRAGGLFQPPATHSNAPATAGVQQGDMSDETESVMAEPLIENLLVVAVMLILGLALGVGLGMWMSSEWLMDFIGAA